MKIKNLFMGLIASATIFACAGKKYQLLNAPAAAAVESKLDVEKLETGNLEISVDLKYLPEASRVESGSKEYLVWAKKLDGDAPVIKLGRLPVDDDRSAKGKYISPYSNISFMITPEENMEVEKPTHAPILWKELKK